MITQFFGGEKHMISTDIKEVGYILRNKYTIWRCRDCYQIFHTPTGVETKYCPFEHQPSISDVTGE